MKLLIPILVGLALITDAYAEQRWVTKPVLCEDNEYAAQEFYRENELYPLMVGAGVAVLNSSMEQVPVVTYVLYNEELSYMMVVEYKEDEICILSVGAGVQFDISDMENWLGVQ
jgi:hypothetical protein